MEGSLLARRFAWLGRSVTTTVTVRIVGRSRRCRVQARCRVSLGDVLVRRHLPQQLRGLGRNFVGDDIGNRGETTQRRRRSGLNVPSYGAEISFEAVRVPILPRLPFRRLANRCFKRTEVIMTSHQLGNGIVRVQVVEVYTGSKIQAG